MIFLLTEKKKQLEDLADAMGWTKGRGGYQGTFEGKPIKAACASGHLVTLVQPRDVIENLTWDDPSMLTPMPKEFQFQVIPDNPKMPPHVQPQAYLNNIEANMRGASEVILATDADREGEAVGWYILNYLGFTGPVRRAWFSKGLDKKSLKEAMSSLRPSSQTKGWFRAAEARGRSDWYYMLLVIAYTHYASYGKFGQHLGRGSGKSRVFSVGRVQTPALAMIVNRDLEIENFVSKDHFKISASFGAGDSGELRSIYTPVVTQEVIDSVPAGVTWEPSKVIPKDGEKAPLDTPLFTGKAEVDAFKGRLINAKDSAVVKSYVEGTKNSNPPKTFALSDAQGAVAKACKISAGLAQTVLEDLYEQGWISYARTSKQDLPENIYDPAERNALLDSLKQLSSVGAQAQEAADIHNGRHNTWRPFMPKVFTKKHLEHHGIVPTKQVMTDTDFRNLRPVKKDSTGRVKHSTANMQQAYEIVVKQFITTLYPPAVYATQSVKFSVPVEDMLGAKETLFSAKGERITDPGYLTAFKGDTEKDTQFPKVSNGDPAVLKEIFTDSAKTKPPSRYTEVTFTKAMEKVGKDIADPKLRKLLQNSEGIGTPATRKTIVETLLSREFIKVDGKGTFFSTPKGRDVIKSVPEWLSSPENTALWEDYLVKICDQQNDDHAEQMRDGFVTKQREQLENLIKQLQSSFDGNLGEKITPTPKKVTPKMKEAIEKIAKFKKIAIPSGTLRDPVKAKAFLDEHMVKRDPNDTTPSEGQINFAKKLIDNLPEGTAIPENTLTDRAACSAFIEKYKTSMPPTEKALAFARKLAEQTGVQLPDNAATNGAACTAFINENKDKVPPTEGQKAFAQKIIDALPEGTTIPDDVMTNITACSAFIDKNKGVFGKGGKGGSKGGKGSGARKTPYKRK